MIIFAFLVVLIFACIFAKKYGIEGLLIFTSPVHRIFIDFGFALKPFYIIVLLAIFAALPERRNSAYLLKSDHTFKLIFIFFISIMLSTLMNGANPISFRHLIVFSLIMTGAYLIYRKISTIDDMRRITRIYLASGLFFGLTGLAFYALYYVRPDLCVEGSIFNGVIYDLDRSWTWPSLQAVDVGPNGYAMSLIPFLFVSLGGVLSGVSFKERIYAGFVFLLLFANMFLTFSRGGLVSFLVVALIIVLLSQRRKVLKLFYIMIIVLSFPFVYHYVAGYYITYSIMKGAYTDGGGDLLSSRGDLFLASWNVFLDHPLFGVGQGVISDPTFVGKQSHNTYIELLAENGIGSLLLFSILLWSLLRKMLYIQKQARISTQYYFCMPFVFGMIGLLVAAIPTSAITMTLMWIQIAIILAFYNVIKGAEVNGLSNHKTTANS